jgi:iron complex outermembrane recepter protein
MTTILRCRSHVLRKGIALLSVLALAMSAHAQQTPKAAVPADEALQEVVVTGSRIARPDLDRLEPTTTVDSKTFDQRGYTDVGQALSELPGFGVQPSSSNNQQSAFGIAQSFVDLYSLGSQRTLVLVNGRRFVSSNTSSVFTSGSNSSVGGPGSQVDLNVVPTKLIDRVETISVGGAPVYGADAIAGTVNIILKKNYEGLDVDGQVGASGQGDAWNYRTRVLAGQNFADGRGNITGVAEFTKSDGLLGTQRANYARDLQFESPATPGPFNTVLIPNGTVTPINFGGIPLVDDLFLSPAAGLPGSVIGVTNPAGQTLAFGSTPNSGSALVPYNVGAPSGNAVFASGGDGERLSQTTNLLSPTERINVDILPNFKINDHVNLYGEGWFSETHATNLVAQPLYQTPLFNSIAGQPGGNLVINVNNPFISPGDRALIQAALNNYAAAMPLGAPMYPGIAVGPGQPVAYPAWNTSQFYLSRGSMDLENGQATATQVVARGVVGVNGDFSIFNRNYTWDISANYGTSSNTSFNPQVVYQNLANALNATTNAAGQIVCAGNPVNAPIATESPTCAPLNIFGNGSPSQVAKEYITHLATATSYNTQRDLNANLAGDIWQLPGGEWKGSIGFENRRESADFSPDAFYTLNLGQNSQTAVAGSYRTNEVSVETLIPIFGPMQEIPVLHRLELEAAARRVDNSVAGSATTYTYGVHFSPIEDITFRGNKTKSIRAPSITELFLPTAQIGSFAQDPCDHNYVNQGTAPATRFANCVAAGIDPTTFNSTVVNATAQGFTGGNSNLVSETAFSKTFGVVLRPRFIPKLSLTVDYIDIFLKDAIETLSLTDNMDACYDSPDFPNAPACASFTRNANHQVTSFHVGYVNAGLLEFTGIQAALDYTWDLPWALGSLETRASYLDTERLQSQVGDASSNSLAGELNQGTLTGGGSKRRGNLDLLYSNQGFYWDWQGIFIGGANFNNMFTPTTQNYFSVGNWWLINSTIGMQFNKQFRAQLIVDNVFNKQPPFPALAGTGGNFVTATSTYFSGVLGRALQLSLDYKFY